MQAAGVLGRDDLGGREGLGQAGAGVTGAADGGSGEDEGHAASHALLHTLAPMTALLSAPVEPDRAPRPGGPSRTWRQRLQPLAGRGGWLATLAVTLLAGVLRFVRLDIPFNGAVAGKVFDEVYYACDAQNLLRFGVEHVTLSDPDDTCVAGSCTPTDAGGSFVVHPPLGKWAIALGIKLFGVDAVRLAVAGGRRRHAHRAARRPGRAAG